MKTTLTESYFDLIFAKMAGVKAEWSGDGCEEEGFVQQDSGVQAWDFSRLLENSSLVNEDNSWRVEDEYAEPSSKSNSQGDHAVNDFHDPLDSVTPEDSVVPSISDQLMYILKDLDELPSPEWNFSSTPVPTEPHPFSPKQTPGPLLHDTNLDEASREVDYFKLFYTDEFLQQVRNVHVSFQMCWLQHALCTVTKVNVHLYVCFGL